MVAVTDERAPIVQGPARLPRQPHRCRERHDPRAARCSRTRTYFLTPGFSARQRARLAAYRGVLVPDEADRTDQDRRVVCVVASDGSVSSRVVRPGPRIDGYRVIREGLTGDETIVITGLQRVRPGGESHSADDRVAGDASAKVQQRSAGTGMRFAHFFVDRPIFASVLSIVSLLVGGICLLDAARRAVSRDRAADDRRARNLSGRQRRDRRGDGGDAARAGDQRRRGHALHVVLLDQRRRDVADHHVQARHRPR